MRRSLALLGMVAVTVAAGLLAAPTRAWASGGCTVWSEAPDEQDPQELPPIPGIVGGFSPAVDLVKGVFTPDFGSGTLDIRVDVQDMSLSVPNGAASMTYATGWAINTSQEQVAYVRVDSGGTVSYYDFNSLVPDAGSYQLGPDGWVEVDVPFSHFGIQRGSVLPGVSTETSLQYTVTGSGSVDLSPTPAPDYTVGAKC